MSGITKYAVIETALCIGGKLHEGEVLMVRADEHDGELAALREENKKVQKRYEDMTDRAVEFEGAAESAELGLSLALQRETALREELENRTDRVATLADERNKLQQRLTAAEQRNAAFVELLERMLRDDDMTVHWFAQSIDEVLSKPTESGASE